ncbi:ketol-acid reductoisomerase [Escherichia coli]|uniref:Ketol-acid reductoisomerase n=1 Tax=Escherichia coli TaxID=562 RepID=A0A376MLZ3_ECOLX|nr:ketol-acid reductoisomerase [Escherichia coli]
MANYFNTLNLRQQLAQLGKCRFMGRDEFARWRELPSG